MVYYLVFLSYDVKIIIYVNEYILYVLIIIWYKIIKNKW